MRWQPPAFTPLSLGAVARGSAVPLLRRDERPALAELLLGEYQADDVVLTDSGTHALQLAIRMALGDRGRSRVAIPAYGCYDLVTAAVGAGAEIVFYDVDPDTLGPAPGALEAAAATVGVGAVVAVPLFGVPLPWDRIRDVARRTGAHLIEDAAQGFGGLQNGLPMGALGDASILSFGRGKGWTGGCGGALLVRKGFPRRPAREAPGTLGAAPGTPGVLARSAAQAVLGRPGLYGLPARLPWLRLGETRYHAPTPARHMPAAAASLLLHTREAARAEAAARRERARTLIELVFGEVAAARVAGGIGTPGFLRLPVRLPEGMATFPHRRGAERLGILGSYPRSLPELPAAGPSDPSRWPGAATLARELVTLPTHSLLSGAELRRVAATVRPLRPTLPLRTAADCKNNLVSDSDRDL